MLFIAGSASIATAAAQFDLPEIFGASRQLLRPTGERSGNTVSNWLRSLHMIRDPVENLAYRISSALGLAIAMLSATGVYIWWRKRRARNFSKAHPLA